VPGVRHSVAEGMYGAAGIGAEFLVRNEEHAGGSERDGGAAGIDSADATGGSRIIAAAPATWEKPPQALAI
jgi:hypothetical protein